MTMQEFFSLHRCAGRGVRTGGLLSLLLAIGLGGCRVAPQGRYEDPKRHFSVQFPQGWEVRKRLFATAVVAWRPRGTEASTFRENMKITSEGLPASVTLDDYWTATQAVGPRMQPGFQVVEASSATVSGVPAKRAVYVRRQDGTALRVIVYLALHQNQAFTLTCSFREETFAQYAQACDATARTLRLDDGASR
jgi:hypothetical protein